MRIDSAVVGMESVRKYRTGGTSVRHEMIKEYRQNSESEQFGNVLSDAKDTENAESGELSARGLKSVRSLRGKAEIRNNAANLDRESKNVAEDLRQITIRFIFDLLFATRRRQRERWLEEHGMTEEKGSAANGEMPGNLAAQDIFGQGNVLRRSIVQESTYYEEEHTGFSAMGAVKTADGRTIDFKIDVAMSRSFEMTFRREIEQVKQAMKDPLVINFDASAAQVKDQKFFFDLDGDGREEEISTLESGSGFLALDKDGDGRIGNGSELFGTGSGDGFRDLAAYDEDGNGWIDENDEVWSKLKIWAKDEFGSDVLYRLADKNIGAIYLGNTDTEYSLIGRTGRTDGMIRRTGIFLYENGLAGTVQHVDLATYQKEA